MRRSQRVVGNYNASGILGKLAWWNQHIWSSQNHFDRWTLILFSKLVEKQLSGVPPPEDLEICATHLANYTTRRVSIAFIFAPP